jgi:hypothetical protein
MVKGRGVVAASRGEVLREEGPRLRPRGEGWEEGLGHRR